MKRLLAGLMTVLLLVTTAFGEEDFWAGLESRYYEDFPQARSVDTGTFLEERDTLDWSRAVRRYNSEDTLYTREGIETFVSAMRSGQLLSDRIEPDGRALVYVKRGGGGSGTAIVHLEKEEVVGYLPSEGGAGEGFVLRHTAGVRTALEQSGLDLSRTKGYYLLLNGLGAGILYTDGRTELFQPTENTPEFLETDTAYTLAELADLAEENAASLDRYTDVNENLDPEKPNVVTGGSPAQTKPPVDTGR